MLAQNYLLNLTFTLVFPLPSLQLKASITTTKSQGCRMVAAKPCNLKARALQPNIFSSKLSICQCNFSAPYSGRPTPSLVRDWVNLTPVMISHITISYWPSCLAIDGQSWIDPAKKMHLHSHACNLVGYETLLINGGLIEEWWISELWEKLEWWKLSYHFY